MKSIIIFFFFFIILSFTNTVFSRSHHKISLYDVIRKSMNKNTDPLLLVVRLHKDVSSTTSSPINQQSKSMKDEENIKVEQRDASESGEDNYFKWASLNRRPMESLAGRKRSLVTSRPGRINGGMWQSGLIG